MLLSCLLGHGASLISVNDDAWPVGVAAGCVHSVASPPCTTSLTDGALVQRPMDMWPLVCGRRWPLSLWCTERPIRGRHGVRRGPGSNKTDPWCRITDLHKSAAKAFMIESLLCVVTPACLHCAHQCVCWPHGALTMAESVLSNDLCCCCCAGQFSFLSFLILRKENGHLDHFGLQDHQPTIVLCHASS